MSLLKQLLETETKEAKEPTPKGYASFYYEPGRTKMSWRIIGIKKGDPNQHLIDTMIGPEQSIKKLVKRYNS
jgi:hypothetical protein